MSDPYPLATDDYNQFMNDLGSTLQWLPSWGGIYEWHHRFILAYVKPDYSVALTDITGGIPDSSVRGGYIPASVLVQNVPRTETTALEAFFYSLPSNFYARAKEVLSSMSDDAIAIAAAAGQAAGAAASPLVGGLWPVLLIAGGVLLFMYMPRSKSA